MVLKNLSDATKTFTYESPNLSLSMTQLKALK